MTKTFLPEWSQMPDGEMYRPIFKLMAGEHWRMVFVNKMPVRCASASEAVAAAKAHVERLLNPAIRSELMEPAADVLGIAEWRERRQSDAVEERKRVFGDGPAKLIFPRRGKPVEVVNLKRRARV